MNGNEVIESLLSSFQVVQSLEIFQKPAPDVVTSRDEGENWETETL